ncbi:putative lipoprotein lppL [Mycobacterium xenopi 4042]|uniref:Putative lipoprotein lppL n=1 Tax=Mycobacterium xenopi 4042 TaxID=1299334 RepID=X8BFS4_MYCXE|nr:putative lipoprotein lppL [Mycobacterium xenopi 4042]
MTLAAGCSSHPLDATPPTISPAKPADSPPPIDRPAGVVLPLGGHPHAAMFDAGTSRLAVLSPARSRRRRPSSP